MRITIFSFTIQFLGWLLIVWFSFPIGISIWFFARGAAEEFGQTGSLIVAFGIVALSLTNWVKTEVEKRQLERRFQSLREKARRESAFNFSLIMAQGKIIRKKVGQFSSNVVQLEEKIIRRNKHDQLDILSSRLELALQLGFMEKDLARTRRIATWIEVCAIITGTLQWGYGTGFVKWYYC